MKTHTLRSWIGNRLKNSQPVPYNLRRELRRRRKLERQNRKAGRRNGG